MGNASILFHCNALIKYIVVIYVYPDFFYFSNERKNLFGSTFSIIIIPCNSGLT